MLLTAWLGGATAAGVAGFGDDDIVLIAQVIEAGKACHFRNIPLQGGAYRRKILGAGGDEFVATESVQADPVNICSVGDKVFIAAFEPDALGDEQENGRADGQPDDIDSRIALAADKVSECRYQIIFEHGARF